MYYITYYNAVQHPYNKTKRKFDIKKRYISDIWNIYDFTTVELPSRFGQVKPAFNGIFATF